MRIVFAGTPRTALPALEALIDSRHDVIAVITRPDAAAGRGRRVTESAVAQLAADRGIEVLKPVSVRDPAFQARLTSYAPDCCPVVAYGVLLPSALLSIPRHGWVNLHFSLLPAWRGAAPVQRCLIAGDDVTGATTFRIVEALDAGPVYGVVTETVRRDDTAGSLLGRLAESGAGLLVATLDGIDEGSLEPLPQPADGISLAPKVTVEEARIDWRQAAYQIDRVIRACTPSPGAWTTFDGRRVKIGPVLVGDGSGTDTSTGAAPGELAVSKADVVVATSTSTVTLTTVQPEGKQSMPAAAWARGLRGSHLRLGT